MDPLLLAALALVLVVVLAALWKFVRFVIKLVFVLAIAALALWAAARYGFIPW